jgi:hypothetical protein
MGEGEISSLALNGAVFGSISMYLCLQVWLRWSISIRVRELDPELSDRLGHNLGMASTSWQTIVDRWRWFSFLWKRRFREVGDARLSRLCYGVLLMNVLGFSAAAILVLTSLCVAL